MIKQSGFGLGAVLFTVAVVLLAGFGVYNLSNSPEPIIVPPAPNDNDNGGDNGNQGPTREVSVVRLPLFVEGGDLVCGVALRWVEQEVPRTVAPLDATMRALFALPDPAVIDGVRYQNPIGYQVSKQEFTPLRYSRAVMERGVASIYLEGSLTGVGTCYDPLPAIQLDATVKQFPTVDSVRYFLNGAPFDPAGIADQRD